MTRLTLSDVVQAQEARIDSLTKLLEALTAVVADFAWERTPA